MNDLDAEFISPRTDFGGAPLLRRRFELDREHGDVRAATLRVSALGIVDAHLNGRRAAPDLLTPGWTSYEWRLRYAEHDVTELVAPGSNVLGLALGNGWYRGRLTWSGGSAFYGDRLAGYAELTVLFEDGHRRTVTTNTADGAWRAGSSGTTANDLYDGQHIDARVVPVGWSTAAFDDRSWRDGFDAITPTGPLEPYLAPPVRPQLEREPVDISLSPDGRALVDFGQNVVGWVRLRIRGESGQELALRHAEVLEHGELGTRPLRSALATDRYVLSGGDDLIEPTLTFHGFRYVEVDGWDGDLEALRSAMTAVVISSDMPRTGTFACSDTMLNRLHENIVWGMRGNFVDVPTDCPQRDERLGWTGDLAVFGPTAVYLFDAADFLRDWLRDLALEQRHGTTGVPLVVPDVLKYIDQPDLPPVDTAAVWSDVAAWLPWQLWIAYGDMSVLTESYDSLATHARRELELLSERDVWDSGFQFGDWLDPDAPDDAPWAAKADSGVVATACAFRTCTIAADTAALLDLSKDEAEFRLGAERIRTGFQNEYVSEERIRSDCSAVYTLALVFGLLDAPQRVWAGRRLAELVEAGGFRISTGFAATPFLTEALSSTGHLRHAYRLLLQTECPSWLYPVTMGATTIWERWDSMLPDGSINPGEMTSFNHYAFGSVADWMHRTIGGLSPLEPGYRRFLIAPQPGGGLDWAETALQTPHGLASVRWDRTGDDLSVQIGVPESTTAVLRLPGANDRELYPGEHRIDVRLPSIPFQERTA